jgi:hypothetical protein
MENTACAELQIITSACLAEHLCNFDESNADFDPAPRSILSKIGEKSVSLWVNGHSGRCTVMLGFTASRHKFPAFIIWKGVWDIWIHRDC